MLPRSPLIYKLEGADRNGESPREQGEKKESASCGAKMGESLLLVYESDDRRKQVTHSSCFFPVRFYVTAKVRAERGGKKEAQTKPLRRVNSLPAEMKENRREKKWGRKTALIGF